jgi:hypothetical protein
MLNLVESGVVDVLSHFWLGAKWAKIFLVIRRDPALRVGVS